MTPVSVLILAGGAGRRLRPWTAALPKPLLPLPGGRVVDYLLAGLREAGATRLALVIAREHGDFWRFWRPIDVTLLLQEEPRTLAAALATARPWVKGPTLVVHGDNVVDTDWPTVLKQAQKGHIGPVVMHGETGLSGLYILPEEAFILASQRPQADDLSILAALWQDAGLPWTRVTVPGRRFNLNTLEDYLLAHRHMLDHWPRFARFSLWPGVYAPQKRVWQAETALVEGGNIGQYVSIGPKAEVLHAHVQDAIIGPGVRVAYRQVVRTVWL